MHERLSFTSFMAELMSDYEQLKYHAARFAYKHRAELVPSAERDPRKPQITWKQWWERRFGESLDVYAQRHRKPSGPQGYNNGGPGRGNS